MIYNVVLQSRKMGGFCKSCIQDHAFDVEASSYQEAVDKAKEASGLNLEYYKINVIYVRVKS